MMHEIFVNHDIGYDSDDRPDVSLALWGEPVAVAIADNANLPIPSLLRSRGTPPAGESKHPRSESRVQSPDGRA